MPADEQERRDALPRGAVLGAYTVEKVLGHGGFGIVYRARHNELDNQVAIKEYLPIELAVREGASVHPRSASCRAGYEDGLRRFRDEARALIEFQSHPSIVSCREFFRENGTAYLVMEYEEGLSLSELLRRRETAGGRPFDEADLLAVMVPLLEGLARVHETGMLHRDIKPSNILVRRSDEWPVLIDFGAAKQMAAERSKSLAPFTEGYAALEQVGEGKLGSWTDLYAVGAVMWRIVAGGNPPWQPPHPVKVEKRATAALRGEADPMPAARKLGAGRFSPGVLKAIDRCLKLDEKERLRDCGELLGLLRGEPAAAKTPAAKKAPAASVPTAPLQARSRKRSWAIPAAAWAALVAVLAWLAFAPEWNGSNRASREKEAVSTAPQDTALARAEAHWEAVRDSRNAESLRAYIEEYGRVEGAGEWVGQAESLLDEIDREEREAQEAQTRTEEQNREAARRKEAARAAWEKVEGTQSESMLEAYIAQWKRRDGAAEFVRLAQDRLDVLISVRTTKKEMLQAARAAWEEVKSTENPADLAAYIAQWESTDGAAELVGKARNRMADLMKIHKSKKEREEAWEKVKGTQSETVLAAYIAQWEHVAEAAEFVSAARDRLGVLERERIVREAAKQERRRSGRRFRDCAVCPQMVVLPAGEFIMGSSRDEKGRDGDEGPRHRVTIPTPFAVGVYEVTFEEWDACMLDGGCGRDPADEGWGRGSHPIIHMSWEDTQEYVGWLRRRTRKPYRLLSEAEWEYAARAGTRTRYSFGDEISKKQARYGAKKTVPAGSYAPNGFGLYDMHGNVWEWVQDCWNDSYAGAPNRGQAWFSGNCSLHVLRGGSWTSNSGNLRSADRYKGLANSRIESGRRGFRVARTLAP